ncbi:hypothetical protein BJ912DRAFT_1151972 [Pholiota molesta]|nr:hypothetical protein BJ912DRAFT_1151972 [Pholiota molesta]
MASPPPYQSNPDTRPLPEGWIAQYDQNYKTWFYVNTRATPPVTSWTHPMGPPPPQPQYAPPPTAPPARSGSPYGGGYGGSNGYNGPPGGRGGNGCYPQQQEGGGGYGGYGEQYGGGRGGGGYAQGGYGAGSAQGGLGGGLLGGLMGKHTIIITGGGFSGGGGTAEGVWRRIPQQQPQVIYQQAPQKKSGIGMGTVALGGTHRMSAWILRGYHYLGWCGLLGGLLIEDAIDNSYDQGFDQGARTLEAATAAAIFLNI